MTFDELSLWLRNRGFVEEVPFKGRDGKRRWRFDFKHPNHPVAVEYMGLGRGKGWTGNPNSFYESYMGRGGHETRSGLERDYEKLTEAALCKITVVLCTATTIKDGRCQEWVDYALETR